MGDYNIHIYGTGPHHNVPGNDDTDADKLAKEFVAKLKAAGHTIHAASVVTGTGEPISD